MYLLLTDTEISLRVQAVKDSKSKSAVSAKDGRIEALSLATMGDIESYHRKYDAIWRRAS